MTAIRIAAELNVESTEAIKRDHVVFRALRWKTGNTGPSPVFVSLKGLIL